MQNEGSGDSVRLTPWLRSGIGFPVPPEAIGELVVNCGVSRVGLASGGLEDPAWYIDRYGDMFRHIGKPLVRCLKLRYCRV